MDSGYRRGSGVNDANVRDEISVITEEDGRLVGECFTCKKVFRINMSPEHLQEVRDGGARWYRSERPRYNECGCYQKVVYQNGQFLSVDNNPCLGRAVLSSGWFR